MYISHSYFGYNIIPRHFVTFTSNIKRNQEMSPSESSIKCIIKD